MKHNLLLTLIIIFFTTQTNAQLYDAGVSVIISPDTTTLCSSQNVTVKIKNYSTTTTLPFTKVQYSINGMVSTLTTYSTNLAPNLDTTLTIGTIPLNYGNNTLQVWAWYDPVLNYDANSLNDTSIKIINKIKPKILANVPIVNDTINTCYGKQIKLFTNLEDGCSYQWQRVIISNGATYNYPSSFNDTITINSASNYKYRVIVTDTITQCTDTSNFIYTISYQKFDSIFVLNSSGIVSYTNTVNICQGDSVTLFCPTIGNTLHYWYYNYSIIAPSISDTFYVIKYSNFPSIIGYQIQTQDTNGCIKMSNGVNVTINPLTTATITTTSNTICQGDTALLSNVNGGGTFQWLLNGNIIAGANFTNYYATQTGNYQCIINVNTPCADTSNIININVVGTNQTANISTSGNPTICQGNNIVLTCTNANSYQWYKDGFPINGATNSTLFVTQAGNYFCIINNQTVCAYTTNSINITVIPYANSIVTISGNATLCQGDSVLLSCSTANSYQWNFNNNIINGATNQTYYVNQQGNYSCTVNASFCPNTSSNVSITVINTPATPIIINNNGILVCSSTGVNYQWYLNGNIINGATFQNYIPTLNGSYTVVVSIGLCNSNSSNAIVFTNVGINEISKNESFEVYPNPTSTKLVVRCRQSDVSKELYNSVGQLIITTKENEIDVRHLPKGIYFLKCEGQIKKVIVE